jgi:hypothetical protein
MRADRVQERYDFGLFKDRSMGGFSNQPRRLGAGSWIILNDPSHHQRIKEQPDGRQVLPLRRPASRMLIQPCPHVIGLYTLKFESAGRTKAKNERHATRYALRVLGLRTRAPNSSRKVSAVLARADAEVPSNRLKGASSTSPVSVCESSGVIGEPGELLARTPSPLLSLLFPRVETSFSAWIIQSDVFT